MPRSGAGRVGMGEKLKVVELRTVCVTCGAQCEIKMQGLFKKLDFEDDDSRVWPCQAWGPPCMNAQVARHKVLLD